MSERMLTRYLASVSVAGLAAAGGLYAWAASKHVLFGSEPYAVVALATVLVIGELAPIAIARGNTDTDEVSISSTVGMAMLLVTPLSVLITAQSIALVIDELHRSRKDPQRRRRRAQRLAFNIAQYTLAFAAARGVYAAISGEPFFVGDPTFRPSMLPVAWLAAFAFFVLNSGLTGAAFALSNHTPVHEQLKQDAGWQIVSSAMLLGLAPVVAQAVLWSPFLLPFLLLPLVVVHRSAGLAAIREHEALHDSLTGLPNRGLLQSTLRKALADDHTDVALLLIDLDHFKDVNDTLGHPIGDQLIRAVGSRLRQRLRDSEILARLGGDEFAVVARHVGGLDGAAVLAERLTSALREPVEVDGLALQVGGSVGIALAPDHGDTVDVLLQRADVAMYAAKESRGGFAFYNPELDTHSVQRLVLATDLRTALTEHQLWVAFQPQVDPHTDAVAGVEALVRWSHPVLGPIDPERVVNLAASAGLLSDLTSQVLDEGLAAVARWRTLGHHLRLSVNLTARQLTDVTLPEHITNALERHDVPASMLVLEVTESTVMLDAGRSLAVVGQLKDLGIELSIDDFGTGYSSMAHLQRLAPHEIKVDRAFVMRLLTSTSDATIVRSTLELGHSLGMRVVAEGVEDADTATILTDWGCDLLQGYAFARAQDEEQTTRWLLARTPTAKGEADVITLRTAI